MRKSSILLLTICIIALSPMAFGGTFETSVIQNTSPPTAEECIVLNNQVFLSGLEDATGETSAEIAWEPNHHGSKDGKDDANCNWRHEVMQTFEAPADANMGAAAFMLRKFFYIGNVPDPCDANYAPIDTAGGRGFIVSLYVMKDWRAPVPEDRNLLMKWRATLPAGIDSNAKDDAGKADPNSGHAGDWLKFTFNPGFHLKKGQQYGIRMAFASPFIAVPGPGDPIPDPNLHEIMISSCFYSGDLEYYDYMHTSGRYARGSNALYNPQKRTDKWPYWNSFGRDFNFAIFPAASGTLVAMSKRDGEAYWDGKVQLADFAAVAANWGANTRTTLSNIAYIIDDNDAPTTVFKDILVLNDQPAASPDPCLTPRIEWRWDPNNLPLPAGLPTRNGVPVCKYQQIGQSFRAPSTTTMGAIAIQLATGDPCADPCSTDIKSVTEHTSGYFKLKVYSVASASTPPSDPCLVSFSGNFPQRYDIMPLGDYYWKESNPDYPDALAKDLYGQFYLYRAANMSDWITFILPSTVSLTAGNYYAFTLTWDSNSGYGTFKDDMKLRRFWVDRSATDVYSNGTAFYTDSNTPTTTWTTGTFDLDFAILGPQYICNSGINPNAFGFQGLEGDLDGDCKVDKNDLEVLADNWLLSDVITIP